MRTAMHQLGQIACQKLLCITCESVLHIEGRAIPATHASMPCSRKVTLIKISVVHKGAGSSKAVKICGGTVVDERACLGGSGGGWHLQHWPPGAGCSSASAAVAALSVSVSPAGKRFPACGSMLVLTSHVCNQTLLPLIHFAMLATLPTPAVAALPKCIYTSSLLGKPPLHLP